MYFPDMFFGLGFGFVCMVIILGDQVHCHPPAAYIITVQWSKWSHYHRTRVSVFTAHLRVPKGLSLAMLSGCSTQSGLSSNLRLSRHCSARFKRENGSVPAISMQLPHINDKVGLWQMRSSHKDSFFVSFSLCTFYFHFSCTLCSTFSNSSIRSPHLFFSILVFSEPTPALLFTPTLWGK